MSDLQAWLRKHDPLAQGGGLDPDESLRVRTLVVAAERTRGLDSPVRHSFFGVPSHVLLAGAVAFTIALVTSIAVTERARVPAGQDGSDATSTTRPTRPIQTSGGSVGTRHQLHFETPGGTRIIWVLDTSPTGVKESQ